MVFQNTKLRCIVVVQGNEIQCGEFGILEPEISAWITIPGDSAFSDRKPGDLFLTNWYSDKDGMGEEVPGLKSSTDKGRGFFFHLCYYHSFFSFKLFKAMIQRKKWPRKVNK